MATTLAKDTAVCSEGSTKTPTSRRPSGRPPALACASAAAVAMDPMVVLPDPNVFRLKSTCGRSGQGWRPAMQSA